MEENMISSLFPEGTAKSYSPLALAYIGDSVHTLYVRTRIMARGDRKASELHRKCSAFVKAKAQSDAIHALIPMLTEEECAVYKRGRNAKSYTVAKNADVTTYRHATGFEALIGYLYLSNNEERLKEILDRSYEIINTEEE